MEPRKPGKEDMANFQEVHDRMSTEPTSAPMLVIKTNVDPEDVTEQNPYYRPDTDKKAFRSYFENK